MSKITREEDKVKYWAKQLLDYDLTGSEINFKEKLERVCNYVINQQTTPKDIEEVLNIFDFLIKVNDIGAIETIASGGPNTLDSIKKKINFVRNYILTSTPQLSESVEEALNKIYSWSGVPFVVVTNTKILEQHIQAQASEIEDLKGIIIQQSDTNNELVSENERLNEKYELLKIHYNDSIGWNNELTGRVQRLTNENEKFKSRIVNVIKVLEKHDFKNNLIADEIYSILEEE